MKKLLGIIIVIALASTTFTSCKKGENDPGLSLKSRTARLVGEWVLTEMERSSTSTNSGTTYTSTSNFSGTTMTETSGGSSTTSVYSQSLEIMKDGTYKMKQSQTYTEWSYTVTFDGEGTWAWISGNKEDEYKNKERVAFTMTGYTQTASSGGSTNTSTYTATGDQEDLMVMKLDQLGSKTLVITRDYDENEDGDLYSVTETSTYEKQ